MLKWLATFIGGPWVAPVIAIARRIPWWFYLAAVLAIAGWFWLERHDHALVKATTTATEARVNGAWEKRQKEKDDRAAADLNALRVDLSGQLQKVIAERDELADMLREEGDKRTKAFDLLAQERAKRVTPEAIARCDLTRGVIVQFNAGARAANGSAEVDAPADAGGTTLPDDASSGVALDRYTGAVELTQKSLGTCREQVLGWQAYCAPGGVIEKAYNELRARVNACFPQPLSPKGNP